MSVKLNIARSRFDEAVVFAVVDAEERNDIAHQPGSGCQERERYAFAEVSAAIRRLAVDVVAAQRGCSWTEANDAIRTAKNALRATRDAIRDRARTENRGGAIGISLSGVSK